MVSISIGAQTLHKISYYSGKFNGRHTTNGERYSSKRYTCAHRTYKFGTLLKIRNPKNGKEVVVVVNDRGPHVKGIYLDISYIAAKELGIIKQGIAKVEVTVIDSDEQNLALNKDTTSNDSIKIKKVVI